MGTFMCEDNYVITRMKGYFYEDGYTYESMNYEPGETINYAFQFINNQGQVIPHTFGYEIWDYSFFVTQDCDLKGSYTINKYDNYTLILSIPACTTVGQHSIRINEEKKGAGGLSYYSVIPGPMAKITLIGHDGIIGTVPIKSETETYYLNYGESNSGDFFIKDDLKIILDLQITDKYGNKVSINSPNSLFTLKKVNADKSTSNVNNNIISYTLAENGNYYQMTISVAEIGTYQIEKNDYMEKPIKFTVIPGEASYMTSYCTLDDHTSNPTVNVDSILKYRCYLRDKDGNEISINTFIQNSMYEFTCFIEKYIPSYNTYNPMISDEGSSYVCVYTASEVGTFAFNGFLRLKTNKDLTRIPSKINQFYVRGDPREYTIKKILDISNYNWIDIDTVDNTEVTYVDNPIGFITALDFAEKVGNVLVSLLGSYHSDFKYEDLRIELRSPHDENYYQELYPRSYSLGGRPYVGIYTSAGLSTDKVVKKSSFKYYLKFTYLKDQKSSSLKYGFNIAPYITCFHDLREINTKVNINDNIQLITGGDETKIGTILLSTIDNNLYNYRLEDGKIKLILEPSSNNVAIRLVPLSIEGIYDVYARATQDYDGKLKIIINEICVKIINFISEPSQACYVEWVDPSHFIHQNTNGKEIYYEYNGEFDNGNILVNFTLKDKYNNAIEKKDYFTKFSDIYSEEFGTDQKYFSISFNSDKKRYEFRDNIPYESRIHGWVFTARESTCNNKYYVRYDGKKGGSPLTKENSYFTLLSTKLILIMMPMLMLYIKIRIINF